MGENNIINNSSNIGSSISRKDLIVVPREYYYNRIQYREKR